jgi:hypothetical protein
VRRCSELAASVPAALGLAFSSDSPAAKLGNRGGFRFKPEDLDHFLDERLGASR